MSAPVQRGGCHCGAIRFEVEGPLDGVLRCNCSICTLKGFLHWIVAQRCFRLLEGEAMIETYRFNTGVAQHHFCSRCGISPFYVPRSHPDRIDVNVRCLEGIDPESVAFDVFDGQSWERSMGFEPLSSRVVPELETCGRRVEGPH